MSEVGHPSIISGFSRGDHIYCTPNRNFLGHQLPNVRFIFFQTTSTAPLL